MAAGYVKASGEPTIVMQAAVVGLVNAMGQMFNAFKEQTPLVFYSYRTDQTRRAGRDGFEEVANQEQIVQPMTKYSWLARRANHERRRRVYRHLSWPILRTGRAGSCSSRAGRTGIGAAGFPRQGRPDKEVHAVPSDEHVDRAAAGSQGVG